MYDPKCEELAAYFLTDFMIDYGVVAARVGAQELAQIIQNDITAWKKDYRANISPPK